MQGLQFTLYFLRQKRSLVTENIYQLNAGRNKRDDFVGYRSSEATPVG
jgi:hypothetical protein